MKVVPFVALYLALVALGGLLGRIGGAGSVFVGQWFGISLLFPIFYLLVAFAPCVWAWVCLRKKSIVTVSATAAVFGLFPPLLYIAEVLHLLAIALGVWSIRADKKKSELVARELS